MKLSAVPRGETQKVLVYGMSKTGKSRLVGRLAKDFKLNWLDLENGRETLLNDDNLKPEYRDNITPFLVRDTPIHPIAFETVTSLFSKAESITLCQEHGKIGCHICPKDTHLKLSAWNQPKDEILVIDSLTQFTASCMAYITRAQSVDYKLQRDDYGTMKRYMDAVLSYIQNAPINIVAISHVMETVGEDNKAGRLLPVMGSSSTSSDVAKYFGHVIYTDKVGKSHVTASSTMYASNLATGSRTNIVTEKLSSEVYSPLSLISGKKA
jgi:hypothetical protein